MNRSAIIAKLFLLVIGAQLAGCSICREGMRSMIKEELQTTAAVQYFASQNVIGPYSPAVRVGEFLFLSGQIALDPATMTLVGEDIESQTRQVFINIQRELEIVGCKLPDVVQTTVYMKNMSDFSQMNAVYGTYFEQGRYPTRTTVEVSNLPRNALIEITVLAHQDKSR